MTAYERKLLLKKQQLIERLDDNPGPHERDRIKGLLAQIDTALGMLEEAAEISDEQ